MISTLNWIYLSIDITFILNNVYTCLEERYFHWLSLMSHNSKMLRVEFLTHFLTTLKILTI